MVGCGEYSSVEFACEQIVKLSDLFKPNQEKAKYYNDKYKLFTEIYPRLKGLDKDL
jgi:xylulokinase